MWRKRTLRKQTGWFVHDFNASELLSLRLTRQRCEDSAGVLSCEADDSSAALFDESFRVLSLREMLAHARSLAHSFKRPIGVAPETKDPEGCRARGTPLEEALLVELGESEITC